MNYEINRLEKHVAEQMQVLAFIRNHPSIFADDTSLSISASSSGSSIMIFSPSDRILDQIKLRFGATGWFRSGSTSIDWKKKISDIEIILVGMETCPPIEVPVSAWPIALTDV